MPQVHHPIDPISISDVLYYLVGVSRPGERACRAYDIHGPESTTYRGLMLAYARLSGKWRPVFRCGACPRAAVAHDGGGIASARRPSCGSR